MVAVGGDGVVVLAHEREGADGDGFLADVKMQEAAHFALLVELEGRLLEATDAEHVREEAEFLFGGEVGVDGGLGVIDRVAAGFLGLFGSGDAHVWKIRLGYGLRLDRGCERHSGSFAKRKIVSKMCRFGKRKWRVEVGVWRGRFF